MKVLQINTVYQWGSTGKIMAGIASVCADRGIPCSVAYRYPEAGHRVDGSELIISSWLDCHIHNRIARITGLSGFLSALHTLRFVHRARRAGFDVVHLHNLHGSYIHAGVLFRYLKRAKVRVIWTFHDCWPFTGHCAYFTMVKCAQWRSHCAYCPECGPGREPRFDLTGFMWRKKRRWFTGVEDLTIVTPSRWLAELVRQSFLKDYPVRVIYNGIDLSVFRPTPGDFRERHGIAPDTKIVLGVAFDWGRRKGLDVFVELARRLGGDYQIVLVGTDDAADKLLPGNIISVHRTENQRQLAELYTAADVFANPTREDNFPTTNLEALACGTPVVTFDTGGSPEALDKTCGSVVPCGDVDALEAELRRVCEARPYTAEACVKRAQAFDMNARFEEYVRLYEETESKAT